MIDRFVAEPRGRSNLQTFYGGQRPGASRVKIRNQRGY
nr:MAG TPA: hypothetical protein [Caudoviricetes sp.]